MDELHDHKTDYLILDIREIEEYQVSHIPGAIYFGYDHPVYELLDDIPTDQPILVYCSIGYRSEKMGEKLQKRGYTVVKNLYGSIFEWANQGYELHNPQGHSTQQVHTYNKRWSKWMTNAAYEKTW